MFQTILITGGSRENREQRVTHVLTSQRAAPGYVVSVKPEKASDSIKIEDIRELQSSLHHRPPKGVTQFAVLYELHQATVPAQQSLLKLLEEPPSYVRIIMTADSDQRVLPTIVSRSRVLKIETRPWHMSPEDMQPCIDEFKHVLSLSAGKRFERAATLSESENGAVWLKKMITGARLVLHDEITMTRQTNVTEILQKLSHCLVTFERTNTNQRLLLENLLLEIPQIL